MLQWEFAYDGPAEEAEELLAPFNAIGAVAEDIIDASYPEVASTTAGGCVSSHLAISSAMLLEYNVTTQREIYEHFIAKVAENPVLGETAYLWHEGYSTAALQAISSDSTAYPFREENLIM